MNEDQLKHIKKIVIGEKVKRDLLFSTRYFFKKRTGSKFIVNWHHNKICAALEEVRDYKLKLLNINIPPRHSKTELVLNFIAQSIGINPTSNWLYITASDELRSNTSIAIRDIVSHPDFKGFFGVELKKDQNSKNLWRTTQGGGLKTATVFGQITGFGAGQMTELNDDNDVDFSSDEMKPFGDLIETIRNFEGAIVLDDIDKIIDTITNNRNTEKVKEVLFNTILSRKNSSDTPIIHIQQRVGENDCTAALMEYFGKDNPEAKFVVYPVIIDGEPLCERVFSMSDIDKLRTSPRTSWMFQAQYMQNPTSQHNLEFSRNKLKYFKRSDINTDKADVINVIDTADKGDDNYCDMYVAIIGNLAYVFDVIYNKRSLPHNKPRTVDSIIAYNSSVTVLETNKEGSAYSMQIKAGVNGAHIIPVHNSANKGVRIMLESGYIIESFVFRSDYEVGSEYDNFMTDLTAYYRGKTKDVDSPDAVSMASKYLRHKKLIKTE